MDESGNTGPGSVQSYNGTSSHRKLRLHRLYRHNPCRIMIVAVDHPLSDGPIARGGRGLNRLVGDVAVNGADAVILHKGSVRYVDPAWFARTALIVQLSASTANAPDPNAKFIVSSVEEALRLGADAVSVHVNVGSEQEAKQIADMAVVADACDRWNMPLIAMMYPRGPRVAEPRDPAIVSHAAAIAVELGADIVKTYLSDPPAEMLQITASCPAPIVVAGGPKVDQEDQLTGFVGAALEAGAAGVAMGRNIFDSTSPGQTTRRLARLIHGEVPLPAPADLSAQLVHSL